MRLAPGSDENHFTAQPACAIRAGNCDGMSVFESSPAMDEFDVMEFEVLQDALAFSLHHLALVVHEIADSEILFERIVNAVNTTLLEARKIERGFTKRFAGDSASVDAAPTHKFRGLDNSDAFAKISRLCACFFSCRAAADHDEIKVFPGSHQWAAPGGSSVTVYSLPSRKYMRCISCWLKGRAPRRPSTVIWLPLSSTPRSRSMPFEMASADPRVRRLAINLGVGRGLNPEKLGLSLGANN